MKNRRPLILILILTAAALLLPTGPAFAARQTSSPVTVDTSISAAGIGHVGVGILSRTGDGESLASSVSAPATVTYDIEAAVSGGSTNVTFAGGGGSQDFLVRYYAADGSDVTLAVTGKGYGVRKVAAGSSVHLTMVVQVQRSAAGRSGNLAVLASGSGNGDMVMGYLTAS